MANTETKMNDTCKKFDKFADELVAYKLYGELFDLDEASAKALLAHAETCAHCSRTYELALQIERNFSPELRELPLGFAKSIAHRVSVSTSKKHMPSYADSLWWLAPYLAVIVTIAGIAWNFAEPTLPSFTRMLPQIIASPWALVATIAFSTLIFASTLSTAIMGFFASRDR